MLLAGEHSRHCKQADMHLKETDCISEQVMNLSPSLTQTLPIYPKPDPLTCGVSSAGHTSRVLTKKSDLPDRSRACHPLGGTCSTNVRPPVSRGPSSGSSRVAACTWGGDAAFRPDLNTECG